MNLTQYIPFYNRIIRLAIPVVLSQIGQVTVSLVDNMMVGHAGTLELAASAFANNVFIIGMFFGMGITYGLTPLVGKAYGNNQPEIVVKWLKNGIFTHLITGSLLTLLMLGVYPFAFYGAASRYSPAGKAILFVALCFIPSVHAFLFG